MAGAVQKPNQTSFGQTLGKAHFAHRPMSLRKFLEPFDHSSLTDYEAGGKYAAYKTSFAKQQLEDFFERNKTQAWFREKYHPDVRPDPETQRNLFARRLDVFMELYRAGKFDDLSLTTSNEANIVKLLDTVAVKLAGGTEEDVRFMEEFKYIDVPQKPALFHSFSNPPANGNKPTKRESRSGHPAQSEGEGTEHTSIPTRKTRPKPRKQKDTRLKAKHGNQPPKRERENASSDGNSTDGSSSSSSSSSSGDESSSDSERSSESDSGSGNSSHKTSSSESDSSSSSSSDSEEESDGKSGSDSGTESTRHRRARPKMSSRRPAGRNKRGKGRYSRRSGASSENGGDSPTRASFTRGRPARTESEQSAKRAEQAAADDQAGDRSDLNEPMLAAGEDQTSENEINHTPVQRLPLHYTRVLYFPHISFNVYQKDLISLLSTSPHFIRLAVLDPLIMSSSDNRPGHINEPFLASELNPQSSSISLRRVGWASFSAQTIQAESLIDVDLEEICNKLLQQATEAQAPEDLLECLRSARVLPDHLRRPNTDRVRSTSHFLSKLLDSCPERLYSKALLRRHLVLAARLTEELDKARGLWGPTPTAKQPAEANMSESTQPFLPQPAAMDTSQLGESDTDDMENPNVTVPTREEAKARSASEALDALAKSLSSPPANKKPAPIAIDPGEDLLEAATILSSVVSENPLLSGLTDCLVDEGSAEEELLLSGGFQALSFRPGYGVSAGNSSATAQMTSIVPSDDTEMLNLLDRLILYLRIVHSVDFYAPAIYTNEDAMPHPCQLIHVRPSKADVGKAVARLEVTPTRPADLDSVFACQLKRLVRLIRPLDETECKRLGLRDVNEVVEAFVKSNTRRKKRKTDVIWVCLLSDKKFRDPIYVKKHIMNKHLDKVETVKKDNAIFFNNYLLDPMRPQLPLEPHLPPKKRRSDSKTHETQRQAINEVTRETLRERSQSSPRWQAPQRRREESFRQLDPFYQPSRDYLQAGNFPPRPYRVPYFQPRLPFHPYRARGYGGMPNYGLIRRGFPRRPYIDLDAP
ncbi:hypothetical protein CRM22_008747 [Opisthorchis felineus]|uniref:SERRATE/Ars2 N-terminal domain-containing protein n=1 Tax=Opisthorchis felineus TaxID=147828 RepID=A0A4S2LHT7_OPIFE|nr:hypothetical protein CRM22_008747 [Opisthorchis felineus]